MTISDETLMAYLDNELTADQREHVSSALRSDAELRARLDRQQKVHEALDHAFGPAMRDPVPDHLAQLAMTAPVSWQYRLREAFKRLGGGSAVSVTPRYAVMASVLVFGVAIGGVVAISLMQKPTSSTAIMAEGALARALETRLAADDTTSGPRVGVTFVANSGEFCRTFDLALTADNAAGIACRSGNGWALKAMVPAEGRASSDYQLAGAVIPPALRTAVGAMMAGDPLDADGEKAARDKNWSH